MESVFDLHNLPSVPEPKRIGMALLEEVYEVIKDKIRVVAADLNTEVGRRYAILLGIDEGEISNLPQIRIIVPDRLNS
jgi:hypothetical protein